MSRSAINMAWALAGLVGMTPVHAADLSRAVRAAQDNDPTLQSALANKEAAQENIAIARARLLPQINFQSTRQNTSQTTTQDTVFGPQERDFKGNAKNDQFTVRQGLIRPRDWAGYSVGQAQASYGDHKYQSALSDTWSRGANVWLEAVAAQKTRDVLAQTLVAMGEAAKQEQLRFEKGEGTRDSMAEAQAQLAQAQATLQEAEVTLLAKQRIYSLQTGLNPQTLAQRQLPPPNTQALPSTAREGFWQRLLVSTPELLAAQVVEHVNALRADQTKFDHYPTLDLVGSASWAQNDTTNTLGYRYNNHLIGVQLTLPLFSGGGMEASRRQAIAILNASIADRKALQLRIDNQFNADWFAQLGLLERIKAAEQLVRAAEEQRRAAESGQTKGLRTWGDRSNAEQIWARRSTDLIGLQLNLYKIQARLLSLLPTQDAAWLNWLKHMDASTLSSHVKP